MDGGRPIIDSHVHVWDLPKPVETPFPYRSATVGTLLAEMDATGVQRAVLVQPGVYQADHAYLRTAISDYPDRFAAVALIDPFSPQAPAMLDELTETMPLTGIRFRLKEHAAQEANDSIEVHGLLDRIGRLGLTLSILTSPPGLDAINGIARRHPDLRVVVDHLGSPDRANLMGDSYLRSLQRLQQSPNVWLKFSGFYSFAAEPYPYLDCQPLARHVLDSWGAERLIWGSDFPFCCAQHSYPECVAHVGLLLPDLTETEAARIFATNASSLW